MTEHSFDRTSGRDIANLESQRDAGPDSFKTLAPLRSEISLSSSILPFVTAKKARRTYVGFSSSQQDQAHALTELWPYRGWMFACKDGSS